MESNAQARVSATSLRGFKGFNERVSDVSSDVRGAVAAAAEGTARQWPTELEDDHWATNFLEGRAPQKPVVKAAVEGGAGFLGWILAQRGGFFILIGGAIWLISTCSSFFEKPKGSSIDPYRPPVTASSARLPSPATAPYSPPVDDYTESKPMVGNGLKLSGSEVRYCVFEKVRVTKMRTLASSNVQIDRFNDFVADYNSRCGSFQYVPWTRDLAERQARERDAELAAEARAKLGIKARGGGK